MDNIKGLDNHIESDRELLDPAEQVKVCPKCAGYGKVYENIPMVRPVFSVLVKCQDCDGTGKISK